jgi:hypothetical protein
MGMQETATTLSLMERMLKQNENLEIVIEKMRIVESQYHDALKEINPVLESFNDI